MNQESEGYTVGQAVKIIAIGSIRQGRVGIVEAVKQKGDMYKGKVVTQPEYTIRMGDGERPDPIYCTGHILEAA